MPYFGSINDGGTDTFIPDGTIQNKELVNSSIELGTVAVSLGQTIAQPAFDLTSAVNYPSSALSGSISLSQILSTDVDTLLRSNANDVTTGQLQFTKAGGPANNFGQIYLNGGTSNRIDFNTNGVAPPSFTTRSAGTKITLFPSVTGSLVDYALGIDGATLWYSVPSANSPSKHRWYGGTTPMMTLSGSNLDVAGIVSATSFSGDGSQLSDVNTSEFIASGIISNGDTVIINADGTVSSTNGGPNTPTDFETGSTDYISSAYDSTNNKIIIAYKDTDNLSYGTAVVGTVSGNSITFGSPVVFSSSATDRTSVVYDSTNQKVVISYVNAGSSDNGTTIIGTVSGNSISFPQPAVVFYAGSCDMISSTYDPIQNRVVIFYQDTTNTADGKAIVGEVNGLGDTITFGTAVTYGTGSVSWNASVYDSGSQKVILAYREGNSKAIVATVNGISNSISFGSSTDFSGSSQLIAITYDSTNDRTVIAFQDSLNSSAGTVVVGEVDGINNTITFGADAIFSTSGSDVSMTYDPDKDKIIIAFRDNADSSKGKVVEGVVNSSTNEITLNTPIEFLASAVNSPAAIYDTFNQKVSIAYRALFTKASVVLYTPLSDITSENYIGIAAEAISDGATGKITVVSGINTSQTGLTTGRTYYVQNDGSGISTVPSTPSVVAGTSISSTEILVQSNVIGDNVDITAGIITAQSATFSGDVNAANFNSTSDIKLKENIQVIENATSILNEINGVKFTWKEKNTPSIGVIAQEVEKILPELISENDETKRVNYNGLVGVLVEAVKELTERVEELEDKQK